MAANIEIVVALLPEMGGIAYQVACDPLFQRLQRVGESVAVGLAQQEMNVFGHDDVAIHVHPKLAADALKSGLEHPLAVGGDEQRTAMVTREGYEMTLTGLLKALETPGHEESVSWFRRRVCDERT
jgi:hypothetical protein